MPTAGFESRVSAGERPQTHALDRAATGIGGVVSKNVLKKKNFLIHVRRNKSRLAYDKISWHC